MFQESFKGTSRKIEGCLKGVSVVSRVFERSQREFQFQSFKGVSRVFQGSSKGVPSEFLGCSMEVSRVFQESLKIEGCFNGVFMGFNGV